MRNIRIYIAIVILFIIQISFTNILEIHGIIPNLLLIFCICLSVMSGLTIDGIIESAVCGFLSDIAGVLPWGSSVVMFMVFYMAMSFVGDKFYRAKLFICMMFGGVITFLYESANFLIMFMSGTHIAYGLSIVHVILPVCFYHIILAFFMYFIVKHFIGDRVMSDSDME